MTAEAATGPTPPIVIAIDGPSGVGKSTTARKVAAKLEIPYLDTGAMYRCLALSALRKGCADSPTEPLVESLLDALQLELKLENRRTVLLLDGEEVDDLLRTPEISEITSRFAALPRVREWMVGLQQSFGAVQGGVVEGRDIGTVVFPETPFKFYLDAATNVRAARRHQELLPRFPQLTVEEVAGDIEERDRRDSARSTSPLARTKEHMLIDTGAANADAVAARIVDFVRTSCGVQASADA